MSANTTNSQAGQTVGSKDTPLGALPRQIDLDDISGVRLVRAADMPAKAGFERGSLGLFLNQLTLNLPSEEMPAAEESRDADGRLVLGLKLSGIKLRGRQALQGTQIWEADLDGAGTGLPLSRKRRGGASDNAHPTWIETANKQRAKLQATPGGNGAQMLNTYSNHRAAYNDAFTQPIAYSFQSGWATQDIADMADHTNTVVSTDSGEVNPGGKMFGSNTYNVHAQTQKLALLTALTGMAQSSDPTDPYNQAAAAAQTFGTSIMQNNSVKKINDVPAKTASQVYDQVQTGTPADPQSVDDVYNFLDGKEIGGRDANGNAWTMCLTEDERAFVRDMKAQMAEHAERLASLKPVDLVSDALTADLSCFIYLLVDEREDGTRQLLDGRVELDGFDLSFEDSRWDAALGEALAGQVREALGSARFLKSLLHDRIADAMERALVDPLTRKGSGAGS